MASNPSTNANNTFDSRSQDEESDEGIGGSGLPATESMEEDGTTTAEQQTATVTNGDVLKITAAPDLDSLYGLREVGQQALCWQLSSAKPGNGVEQIRDQNTISYWQSDGPAQPHWMQVSFQRRVGVSHVCLFLDYNLDESYTPKTVLVEAGMTIQDLQAVQVEVELHEPQGWCVIPVQAPPDPLEAAVVTEEDENNPENHVQQCVRAHVIRISILSMHQNGRDTHVRQVQLYGPRTNSNFSNAPASKIALSSGETTKDSDATLIAGRNLIDDDDDDDLLDLGPLSTNVVIR